jgi:hypothetical protein
MKFVRALALSPDGRKIFVGAAKRISKDPAVSSTKDLGFVWDLEVKETEDESSPAIGDF